MDHRAILERNVSCAACHADVASADSQVTRRDCERCHDQPRFFADWQEPFPLDVVTTYHRTHVPYQRAKCLDCHSEIHHQLLESDDDLATPDFLTTVMSNCVQCHPNHHAEQVALLRGQGGLGVSTSTPNTMFGSRTNCLGCHANQASDEHFGEIVRASQEGCAVCHGDRHAETFEKWKLGLELVMTDAEEAYNAARNLLDTKSDVTPETRQRATAILAAAKSDLLLVKRGNGVHNVTYSIELLDSVTSRSQEAVQVLNASE
jgi:hypothetical protein